MPEIVQNPLNETPFSIKVERRADAAVVRLAGSCTMNVSAKLSDCMVKLGTDPLKLIVIDMAKLDFIESTGLGAIVAGHLRCRRHDGELRLVSPDPSILHLLEVTRLTQLFRVFPSVEQALNVAQ